MNDKAVCRTAPATPGLSMSTALYTKTLPEMFEINHGKAPSDM